MNTNTNDANELTQPAAITRRGFIKRTSSATMIATLVALGAFEIEAHAAESGSSKKWTIDVTGFGNPMVTKYPQKKDANGSPMVDSGGQPIPDTEGHPQEKVPQGADGGPEPVYSGPPFGNDDLMWISAEALIQLSEPTIHDGETLEAWSRVKISTTWRVTSSYKEIELPLGPSGENKWGYYSTEHTFNWALRIEFKFERLTRDPATNIETVVSSAIWGTPNNYIHSGSVKIVPDAGDITFNPPPAPVPPAATTYPTDLEGEGWVRTNKIYYKLEMRRAPSSFAFYLRVYITEDENPPGAGVGADILVSGTDMFTYSPLSYKI